MTITKDVVAQALQVNPNRIRDFQQSGNVICVFLTDPQESLNLNVDKCKPFINKDETPPRLRKEGGTAITSWTITKGILGAVGIIILGIVALQVILVATTDQGGSARRAADEAEESLRKLQKTLCDTGDKAACDRLSEKDK